MMTSGPMVRIRPPSHSALIPASLITLAHFSVSAGMPKTMASLEHHRQGHVIIGTSIPKQSMSFAGRRRPHFLESALVQFVMSALPSKEIIACAVLNPN